MRIGFDLDGTITDYPEEIQGLMRLAGSKNCFIITARHEGERAKTLQTLQEFGVTSAMYTKLFMYPKPYKTTAEVWQDLIKFKVDTCIALKLDIMVEDDERYLKPIEAAGVAVLLLK